MATAIPGITTSFTLTTGASTQLSAARADPAGRIYVRIDNLSKKDVIAFAIGTGNQASPSHHQVPPGSFFEFRWPVPVGMPLPQAGWGVLGDIAAIAVSGSPTISYLEL